MQTGLAPEQGRRVTLRVEWGAPAPDAKIVRTYINGIAVTLREASGPVWTYDVRAEVLEDEAQVIEFETPGKDTVVRLELAIAAAKRV